jgi:hypothetical protein
MPQKPDPIAGASSLDQAAAANNALWYTFKGIGRAYLVKRKTPAFDQAAAASVHGYPTIESAYSNPNELNVLSQAAITAWDVDASLPVGGGTAGIIETSSITAPGTGGNSTKNPQASTPQNPYTSAIANSSPVKSLSDLVSIFQNKNTWIRVTKVILGGTMLTVGLIGISNAQDKVTGTAGKVIKAALI